MPGASEVEMQGHLIVARFIDGRVEKGTSTDVDPKRPICHILTPEGKKLEVSLANVKALFFVKTTTGRPDYKESKGQIAGDSRLLGTKRVRVVFADKEEIVGLTNRYPPNTPYFFMLPMDPQSNNIRILVNRAAVMEMTEVKG
jgi:hypothetical protein